MILKNNLKKFRLYVGKILIDYQYKHPFLIKRKNINKVLFLRQDGKIGDMVVSSFAFRELKKQNPNLHIGVVCSKNNRYLLANNPYIDSLYEIKKRSIIDRIKCGLQLRKLKYDVLIDPTIFLRNRELLFIRLINAKINIGFLKEHYKIFNLSINNNDLHFSNVYKEMLETLSFHSINTQYDMPKNEHDLSEINTFISENNLQNFICVNFFGSKSHCKFNDSKCEELLKYVSQNSKRPIVILTFPGVTDKLKKLISKLNMENRLFIFENTTSIFHSIELVKRSSLCITPDTSIVHIAVGFNKPLICFYNNDKNEFTHWHPNKTDNTHILRYNKSINEIPIESIDKKWLI